MGRVIKFRAWLRAHHQMVPVTGIGWTRSGNFSYATIDFWREYGTKSDEGMVHGYSTSQVELMQYTGLKDKNGVEIYEGDVIRICHYEPWDESDPDDKPHYSVHKVKWSKIAWVVNPTYSEEYNDLAMVGEGWEDSHLWMEVIGNIYENPALLTA